MGFGFAGAGAGAADALQQLLTTRHAEYLQGEQLKLQQAAALRAAEELAMRKKDSEADQAYRTGQVERQGRQDTEARAARLVELLPRGKYVDPSTASTLADGGLGSTLESRLPSTTGGRGSGVAMQADPGGQAFLGTPDQQVQDGQQQARARMVELFKRPDATRDQKLSAMFESGQDPSVSMLEDPAEVRAASAAQRAAEAAQENGYRMQEIGAQGANQRALAGTRAASGGSGGEESDAYTLQTAERTISAIDGVLPKINAFTAGPVGVVAGKFGYTPALNVSAELAAVASNIAFNALQQMRNASKTGGALGQVSERELDLLSSVEGAIRQNQSPQNLREQLEKVRASMQRVQAASLGVTNMGSGGGPAPTPTGSLTWDPVKRTWVQ